MGLIIHPEQPWLCCSPDGVVAFDDATQLIEIKCPFSLRNDVLIDREKEISYIPYVHYVSGKLTVRKTHQYYTQVMIMLYILGIKDALLFVYSAKHSVSVIIERDDVFLAEFIPKLESFYFYQLLKRLAKQ